MKNIKISHLVIVVFLLFVFSSCHKTELLEMPAVFSDGMVLQRNTLVKIWGTSSPQVKIKVKGSWGAEGTCKSDANGNWIISLQTGEAGGPYILQIVSGDKNRQFENVMLGEVWICSGQSNMEMPLISNWARVDNAKNEVKTANYPNIRLFTVQKNIAFKPIDTMATKGWMPCDTNSVKDFSATAYFFGRKLYQELNIPIGLIHTSWGGTVAEAWTSKNSLIKLVDFAEKAENINKLDASRDSLERKFEADIKQMNIEIIAADRGYEGHEAVFANPELNDKDWMLINLPKMWEETALGNYDGSAWFRREVFLTPALLNGNLTLTYGAPDDYDEAWVNGIKVGENKVWNELRSYPIPSDLVKAGKNVVTIRVYDYTGGGGFMGEPDDFKIESTNGQSIAIAKGWKVKKGFDFRDIKTHPISLYDPNQPTVLFNAMIKPLLPYTIQGAIWYQGESNAGKAYQYRGLFKTLISDWREQWNQGDFPFLFVQLANFRNRNNEPVDAEWAELREAQLMGLELPNTGMAVTIDIGNANDIHPGNKQEVGNRLALNALAKSYEKIVPYSGPIYKSMEIKGKIIEISFDHVYEGLTISNGSQLKGFAIAGNDKKFVWAEAKIVDNKVIVSSPKVSEPKAVRYAWSSNPECNLINSAKLPASPFRTDHWKGITEL